MLKQNLIYQYYTFFTENRDTLVSEYNVIAPITGMVDT